MIEASKEVFEQSDTIHGLALVMVKYVADNFTNYEKEFQIKFLSDCLIFGPIFKKDQVIFSLTNEFIFHNEYSVNYIEGMQCLMLKKVILVDILQSYYCSVIIHDLGLLVEEFLVSIGNTKLDTFFQTFQRKHYLF